MLWQWQRVRFRPRVQPVIDLKSISAPVMQAITSKSNRKCCSRSFKKLAPVRHLDFWMKTLRKNELIMWGCKELMRSIGKLVVNANILYLSSAHRHFEFCDVFLLLSLLTKESRFLFNLKFFSFYLTKEKLTISIGDSL